MVDTDSERGGDRQKEYDRSRQREQLKKMISTIASLSDIYSLEA